MVQRKEDVKPFLDEMNKLFGHKGKDGIRVGDGKDLLGIHRERWTKDGIRYIRMTQAGHIDKTFDLHCKSRREHQQRPPTFPFPVGDGHPVLDNMNKAVGVTPDEAKQILDEGFRSAGTAAIEPQIWGQASGNTKKRATYTGSNPTG